ncbi:2Fe-2S iron-sulfur cluster-binding protein [Nocardia jiangxiensis]|uniref:2Fe-2S iron-sulfur cluster-binding protein n=1 Tax=Nocardia jiangxiensis TaxID=282685 RepID=A0ABW6SBZ2_9NOCA|nr:2Fe-2S iron-sulfur cluster-binding protein [Nocardia jiangxiensis]
MPTVHYITGDDTVHSVDAHEGDTLMHVAVRNGIPGIEGECGGEMSCATCHVYIEGEWRERILAPSNDENDLLEMVDDLRPESRLGCQIKVNASLDGLQARVP